MRRRATSENSFASSARSKALISRAFHQSPQHSRRPRPGLANHSGAVMASVTKDELLPVNDCLCPWS